jgi:Flp pilus assembly protein TadB
VSEESLEQRMARYQAESDQRAARWEAEAEQRREAIARKMHEEERRFWRRMAWKIPLIGGALLILAPLVAVALGLWMAFLIEIARPLVAH